MEDVGPAAVVAERVILRPRVEDQRAFRLRQVGDGEKRGGGRVDHQHRGRGEKGFRRRNRVAVRGDDLFGERIVLFEELAGLQIVGEAEPRALKPLILRVRVEVGQGRRRLPLMQQKPDRDGNFG